MWTFGASHARKPESACKLACEVDVGEFVFVRRMLYTRLLTLHVPAAHCLDVPVGAFLNFMHVPCKVTHSPVNNTGYLLALLKIHVERMQVPGCVYIELQRANTYSQ